MKNQSLPKISFDQAFSSLSLAQCPSQKPSVSKGMFSQYAKCTSQNSKLIPQNSDVMQCKSKCKQDSGSSIILDLECFKTYPCSINQDHDHLQCPYFHNENDHRRNFNFIKQELCPHEKCSLGYNCTYAHNQIELLYHPDYYKTKFCESVPNCRYDRFCPFAHCEKEIRCELVHHYVQDHDFFMFHFKRVPCPSLSDHNTSLCVYYHDYKDYRRFPIEYSYTPCQDQKCSNERCPQAHNYYEAYYHPLFYKTIKCTNCSGQGCPYYHNPQEERVLDGLLQTGIFQIKQRNRIVNNILKQQTVKLPRIN